MSTAPLNFLMVNRYEQHPQSKKCMATRPIQSRRSAKGEEKLDYVAEEQGNVSYSPETSQCQGL